MTDHHLLQQVERLMREPADLDSTEPGSVEQLVQRLRTEAPVARPEYLASLDKRAARGFGKAPVSARAASNAMRRSRPSSTRARRRWRVPALVVSTPLVLLLLAVLFVPTFLAQKHDGGTSRRAESSDPGLSQPLSPEHFQAVPAPDPTSTGRGSGPASSQVNVSGHVEDHRRYILGSAVFLSTTPDRVPGVVADAATIAEDLDGYVGDSGFDVDGDRATGSADIWVPTAKFPQAIDQLTQLGRVERIMQESEDVTGTRRNVQQHVEEAEQLLERIRQSGGDTSSPEFRGQKAAVENQLRLHRQRLANIDRKVRMTLITVRVTGTPTPPEVHEPWTLGWALDTAGSVLEKVASVLLVAAAALALPLAAAGLARFAYLRTRRRRRDDALDDR